MNNATTIRWNGFTAKVETWMGFPQITNAVNKIIRKAIAAQKLDVERLHGEWAGPDWQKADAIDAAVRRYFDGAVA